jgi:hypothetical protein
LDSPTDELVRVVRVRRGVLKPSEFQLRPGEMGLSLFIASPELPTEKLLQAVRDAGKHGELAVALVAVDLLRDLGLIIVRTPGGTPDPEVNAYHREARVRWMVRIWLWLRRKPLHEYFNDRFSVRLCESARLEE